MTDFEEAMALHPEAPTDDEYLDCKKAYRLGKAHYLEAHKVMEETGNLWSPVNMYDFEDVRHTHFKNGWHYQLWMSIHESSIRSGDQWPTA